MKPLLGLLLALFIIPAQAEIYKCRLANGRTEIANTPCPSGSTTLSARPDETVPEATRSHAERDVARMRSFVEQREAEQRREEAADRQQQEAERQEAATRSVYETDNMESCLRELGRQTVDAGRRAELEAICRAKEKAAPTVIAVPVPSYPLHDGDACIQNVLRLRLAPAEQEKRIARCRGITAAPPVHTAPRPTPRPPSRPLKPCPRDDRYCVR